MIVDASDLPDAEAALLATAVDTVLVAVRAGATDREDVRRALQLLSGVGADVAGVLLVDRVRRRRSAH